MHPYRMMDTPPSPLARLTEHHTEEISGATQLIVRQNEVQTLAVAVGERGDGKSSFVVQDFKVIQDSVNKGQRQGRQRNGNERRG